MAALGDGEAVVVLANLVGEVIAVVGHRFFLLGVPCITDALEEQQREDVRLEVAGVHGTSKAVGGGPEPTFEFLLGDSCRAHYFPARLRLMALFMVSLSSGPGTGP